MSAINLCGVRIPQSALRSHERRYSQDAQFFGAMAAFVGLAALVSKVAGAVISIITKGQYTLLSAVIVSTPYFYIPFLCLAATSGALFVASKVCKCLADRAQ